jgi:chaperone required for assembly of F1-ATPase
VTRPAGRFYRSAAAAASRDGFLVGLDSQPVRTPLGTLLTLPTADLAEAVAEEWLAQAQTIRPDTMPLTRLAATALDGVAARRGEVVERLLEYAGTDLLCYRAVGPPDLVARQDTLWQPLLDWLDERLGAVLVVTSGILPVRQPARAMAALRTALDQLNHLELTALASAVQASGSLIIGLALVMGRLEPHAAFEISQLDELYQVERWGDDSDAAERRAALRDEIRYAAMFLALARSPRSSQASIAQRSGYEGSSGRTGRA